MSQATISLHGMTLLDRFVVYTGTGEVGLSLVATLGGCKIDDVPIKHYFWCEAICICKIVGRKYISLSKIYGEVKRNIMKFQKSNARKNFLIKKGKFGIHSVFLGLAVDLQVVCVLEFVIIAINTAMRNAETLSALPPNFEPCHGLKATGLWVEGHGPRWQRWLGASSLYS